MMAPSVLWGIATLSVFKWWTTIQTNICWVFYSCMSHVQAGPSKVEVQCRIECSNKLLTQDSGWEWEWQGISLGPLLPDVPVLLQRVALGYIPSLMSGWLFNEVKWEEKQYTNKFGCRGKEAIREERKWQEAKSPVPRVLSEFERNNSGVNPKTDIQERKYNSKSEKLQERVHYLYIFWEMV